MFFKKLVCAFSFIFPCFIFPALLPAQTAAELDRLLAAPAVSCAQSAHFVLSSLADVGAGDNAAAAFASAVEKGWFNKGKSADDPIAMKDLSYLLMKAFNISGGLMYRIFPCPRYAFRTMISRGFIQGASDPAMKVSGERFLLILGNVLSEEGGER